jgi:hypothetical protein
MTEFCHDDFALLEGFLTIQIPESSISYTIDFDKVEILSHF